MTIKRIAIDSIFLALLIVSTYISIPLSDISLTLQVLVVLLLALILPFIDAEIIIIIYILMGLFGIPVFSNFSGGISKIFTPSFGFIISFIFVPIIIKLLSLIKIKKESLKTFIISLITLIFIYIIGILYLFVIRSVYEVNIMSFIIVSILPLLPFDIIKVVIACFITRKLKPILERIS
ncbi:MAG: biotin transporter BioY [Bacilli bacterium]|nr:biotin transporter BioY [Bacilli bacterium]